MHIRNMSYFYNKIIHDIGYSIPDLCDIGNSMHLNPTLLCYTGQLTN